MKTIFRLLKKIRIDIPFFNFYISYDERDWMEKSKNPWYSEMYSFQVTFCPWLSNNITNGKKIGISIIISPWRIGLNIDFFRPYFSIGFNRTLS
jgi:hypothetical protein